MKTITAAITTYKRPEILPRAINSVLNQTIQPDELIIIDNFGDNETKKIVSSFKTSANLPISYIHEKRKGVSHARNAGINLANTEYIAFLDDDDVWIPHHLAKFHNLPKNLENCVLFSGLRARFDEPEIIILPTNNLLFEEYEEQDGFLVRKENQVTKPFYTPSMSESIIKTSVAKQILFDVELIGREDIYFVWQTGEIGNIIIEKVVHGLADQLDISLFSTKDDASSEDKLEMSLKKCIYGVKMLEKWTNRYGHVATYGMQAELNNAYFASAYFNEKAGNIKIAFSHLAKSASKKIEIKHLKLLAKMLINLIIERKKYKTLGQSSVDYTHGTLLK